VLHTVYGIYVRFSGMPFSQNQMPRTRRHLPRLPRTRLCPQLKLQSTAVQHQLIMLNPVLIPLFPIDLDALHVITIPLVAQTVGGDAKGMVAVDSHVDIVEPRRA
jgi:hypothetical protein